MANRYMSNLRSNASPGYYDTISAIVAADSQARSAAIQSQYGAMSNSITVIADSMIKGMNSAANYQLEQEKLITARRIAESEIAAKATEMQIREQEAESQRLYNQAQLAQITRQNRQEDLRLAVTPYASEFIQRAPAIASQIAQAESLDEKERIRKDFVDGMTKTVSDAEAGIVNGVNTGKPQPGLLAAWASHNSVLSGHQEFAKQIATSETVSFTDPVSGSSLTQKAITKLLKDPNASSDSRMLAARIAASDPNAPQVLRDLGTGYFNEALKSNDPYVRMEAEVDNMRRNNRGAYDIFQANLAKNMTRAEAFANAKTMSKVSASQLRAVLGMAPDGEGAAGTGGAEDPVKQMEALTGTTDPMTESKRKADSIWGGPDVASKKDIGKAFYSGSLDAISRTTALATPAGGLGVAVGAQIAKHVGRPFVQGDTKRAERFLSETRKEVESRASTALNGTTAKEWRNFETTITGTDKYKPGTETMRTWFDKVVPGLPGNYDKDAMMSQFAYEGIQLLPQGYDPAVHLPLSSLGAAGEEISKYALQSSADVSQYKTVLGLVLAEKKADPTASVSSILRRLQLAGKIMPYSGFTPQGALATDSGGAATSAQPQKGAVTVTAAPAALRSA